MMTIAVSDAEDKDPTASLRSALEQGNGILARVGPTLTHLLAAPDSSLYSDELVARVRAMCHDLAWQVLRAQAEATGEAGREAFADRHGEALASHLFTSPQLISHCHTLALEWQLAMRMEVQYGMDPVLSPLLQQWIASSDTGRSSAAMAALAAQARFSQFQRRMELPLLELPGELLHELLLSWRTYNGQRRSDAFNRAEAKLRNGYDESAGRLALLARLVAGMGDEARDALDLEHAGVSLFVTALALRSRQSRAMAVLSTNEKQSVRLCLGLRAAGLGEASIRTQIVRLHRTIEPMRGLDSLSATDAAQMLADAGSMGIV